MTPEQIRSRRHELDLTVDELAFALNLTEDELLKIEAGESKLHLTAAFRDAFDSLEDRVLGTLVGV
jgi:transcriptional regulator with XRE-family HTH domain